MHLEEEIVLRKKELEEIESKLAQSNEDNEGVLLKKITTLESRVRVHTETVFRLEGDFEKQMKKRINLKLVVTMYLQRKGHLKIRLEILEWKGQRVRLPKVDVLLRRKS